MRPFGFSAVTALALLVGCAAPSPPPEPPLPETPEETLPPAPWAGDSLPASSVPEPYLNAWMGAENRADCALIAPAALGIEGDDVAARQAQFGGGWGVAYDLPDLRSAFGVAGTGAEVGGDTYDEWPHERAWADGSTAGYGPEGGTGPNQLAYLRIRGQRCLYNVWSRLGRQHLERLLDSLRFVETGRARTDRHPIAGLSGRTSARFRY